MSHTSSSASQGRRGPALAVLCAGMLMIILDGTIVTVALPAIGNDLSFAPSNLPWVLNSYMIAFGGLLLLSGRLGDLLGRRGVFTTGLMIFTAASLLCALSPSAEMLIAARFVQGIGGAMAAAVSLGMIVTLFPEPREQARAFGAFGFVGAAGASIGLVLGGLLTEALNWHWIFLINVPIGLAAAVLTVRVIGADRGIGLRAGADVAGALLVTSGLMTGVYTIVQTSRHGWASAHSLGFGGAAILLLAAFLARQATAAQPLLPLRMFRSRNVSGANVAQALMVAAGFGFQVTAALYMQRVLGYGAAAAGLGLFPAAVVIGTLSLGSSARLNARFGERAVLLAGLTSLAAGLALLARIPVNGQYAVHLLPTMLLVGGFGLALPALTALAMSGATAEDAGLASGLFNTTQQVGAALGVAVLSTLATSRADGLLAGGHGAAEALSGGYRLAFGVAAALAVAAAVTSATVLRGTARGSRAPARPDAPDAERVPDRTASPREASAPAASR